jgi:hypothetical protein
MKTPIQIVAETFATAKDAPTSFEPQEWLEGFEAARCMIAVRLSTELEQAGAIESASSFLDDCGIPEDTEKATVAANVEQFGGSAGDTFAHTPDNCPSKHWNRGDDICADCGENLQ